MNENSLSRIRDTQGKSLWVHNESTYLKDASGFEKKKIRIFIIPPSSDTKYLNLKI